MEVGVVRRTGIQRLGGNVVVVAAMAVACWAVTPSLASATGEGSASCTAPTLNHAIVVFGDGDPTTSPEYESINHTFGNADASIHIQGIAIDGDAKFGSISTSVNGTPTNYLTGTKLSGNLPQGTWVTDGTFPYNQQDWIDYANALADAAEADPSAYPNVNVYRLNGGTATITNDGPDYPSPANQKLHVAVGSGTLYTTQGQNDKTDGAILAPEATVDIDRKISHIDGWVVAEQIIESYWVNTGGDTGLQIHGKNPDAFVDVCTNNTTTTTAAPTTTTTTTSTTTTTTSTTTTTTTTTVAPTTTTTTTSVPATTTTLTTVAPSTTTIPPVVESPEESPPADPETENPAFTG